MLPTVIPRQGFFHIKNMSLLLYRKLVFFSQKKKKKKNFIKGTYLRLKCYLPKVNTRPE